MFYSVSRFICLAAFKLFFRISSQGAENIPKEGGFILASNHASFLDPVALGVSCRRSLIYMARDSLFRNRIFGWLLARINTFPLKRESADVGALREAIKRLNEGAGLVLFPGGTRTQNGLTKELHEGVGFLSAKANVPIVPAFIRGSGEALPKGAKFFKPKKITVLFGGIINAQQFKDYSGKGVYKLIADKTFSEIKRLEELSKKT